MVTLVTRSGKGSPLTNAEIDANFTGLKAYTDSVVGGVNFHPACNYATIAALSPAATYSNGASGVGATLTGSSVGALSIDGVGLDSGDEGKRILVKNQGATAPFASLQNGIYVVTRVGTPSLTYILTRATDYDKVGSFENEIEAGDFILVLSGGTLANTSWVQQTQSAGKTIGGTLSLQFDQFSSGVGSGTINVANGGTGQTANGTPGQYLIYPSGGANPPVLVWKSRVTKTLTSTAPTSPLEGDTWLDTTTGIWSMYLTAGNGVTSAGWVEIGRP
jgi:hypothetical protein